MKTFGNFLLCLLLAASVTAQPAQGVFTLKGSIDFLRPDERINHALKIDGGSRLLLIGRNEIKHADVAMARVLSTYTHDIPGLSPRGFLRKLAGLPAWLEPSPDGLKGILIEKADGGKDEAAVVWDLRTGKRAAVFERLLKPAREAKFSKNGKTIVSTHGHLKEMEICFWDGETYSLRSSIIVRNLGWYHLTGDGERVLTAAGEANKWLGLSVTDYEDSKTIDIWNTADGKLEKALTTGAVAIGPYPKVSRDDRLIAALSGDKIVVWDAAAGTLPKYEIPRPPEEKSFQLFGFTNDSRYLIAYSKENGRLYEADTGKPYREFATKDTRYYTVSADSRYVVLHSFGSASIYDVEAGKILHHIGLRVDWRTDSSNPGGAEEVELERARISPNGKFVMILSNETVRILDTKTGSVIQTLVDPQRVVYKPNGEIKSSGLATGRTDWLAGGDAVYILRDDLRSALLWSAK